MVTVDYLVLGRKAATIEGAPALVLPGLGTIHSDAYPMQTSLAVGFRLNIPWSDRDKLTKMHWDVLDEQERSVWPVVGLQHPGIVGMHPDQVDFPHDDNKLAMVHTLNFIRIPKKGWYAVVLYLDGKEAGRTLLRVGPLKGTNQARAAGITA